MASFARALKIEEEQMAIKMVCNSLIYAQACFSASAGTHPPMMTWRQHWTFGRTGFPNHHSPFRSALFEPMQ